MSSLPKTVRIVEVGPRDGLQNESAIIPTPKKAEFIHLLGTAGLQDIEVASFVHPNRVPQLADADELVRQLECVPNVRYSALVPNVKGLERAIQSGIRRIAVFTAASETFNKKNINMGIQESIDVFKPVVDRALKEGLSVRGYVSTCFVCPYEGPVAKEKVADVAGALFRLGVDEVSIGFTIFDSSAGGLGGCPYAPGASGNLATEDLVYLLDRLGIKSGVSLDLVRRASYFIARELGRDLPSRVLKTA